MLASVTDQEAALTHVDESAVVVERAEVGRRQAEERVQLVQVRRQLRPRQHVADDDVAQRVADEADSLRRQVEGLDVVRDLLGQPVRQRVEVGECVALRWTQSDIG